MNPIILFFQILNKIYENKGHLFFIVIGAMILNLILSFIEYTDDKTRNISLLSFELVTTLAIIGILSYYVYKSPERNVFNIYIWLLLIAIIHLILTIGAIIAESEDYDIFKYLWRTLEVFLSLWLLSSSIGQAIFYHGSQGAKSLVSDYI